MQYTDKSRDHSFFPGDFNWGEPQLVDLYQRMERFTQSVVNKEGDSDNSKFYSQRLEHLEARLTKESIIVELFDLLTIINQQGFITEDQEAEIRDCIRKLNLVLPKKLQEGSMHIYPVICDLLEYKFLIEYRENPLNMDHYWRSNPNPQRIIPVQDMNRIGILALIIYEPEALEAHLQCYKNTES